VSLENPLAYCVLMLVILATSQLIVSSSVFFRNLVAQPGGRFSSLDGFRGFLASGVFVHHAVVNYGYYRTGIWQRPTGRLYDSLGGDCVLYFFMITGLLFWTKCLKGGARIDAKSLVASRIKRLMPAYLASVVLVFVAMGIASHFELRVPGATLLFSASRWLFGGLAGSPDVNGISPLTINGAVTWTLQYEWIFYLSLPFIAVFATLRRFPILVVLFAVFVAGAHFLGWQIAGGLMARFFVGMAIAHLMVLRPTIEGVTRPLVSAVVLGCLVVAAAVRIPRALTAPLMTVAFAGIVYGNDLFGLLRTRAAVLLGHVSYSVYLLHCLVLYVGIHVLSTRQQFRDLSSTQFWLFCLPVAVVVVLFGALSYRFVEHPFLAQRVVPGRATDPVPPAKALKS
jgi:peptidoglycan/LPS O-acetylase OafA/YrhL